MQLRSTLVLALLFAALGAYLYFVEMERDPNASAGESLARIAIADVTQVEIEHPGRRVVLVRREDDWQMTHPVDAPADRRSAENLVKAVNEFDIQRTLDDTDDVATFGLDAPSATIRLLAGDQPVLDLDLGKNTPVGNSAYARRGGDGPVLLVDRGLATRIDKKASDLRDKRVLVFEEAEVDRVEIQRVGGTIELERVEGAWLISAPAEYDADGTAVGRMLSSLQSMRATDFVDDEADDLEPYGLAAPATVVTLRRGGAEALELRLGNEREGKLRVQTNTRPAVYAVPAWIRDSVDRDVLHFRDKTISSFALEDARTVILDDVGERWNLARQDDTWTSVEGQPIDAGAVDGIVEQMSMLAGFEIVADPATNLGQLGLDPPRRTIEVRDAEGVRLGAISIGNHSADGANQEYSALVPGRTPVFHLRPGEYERLIASIVSPASE